MREANNVRDYAAENMLLYILTIKHFKDNCKILNFFCIETCQIQLCWILFGMNVDACQESAVSQCHWFVEGHDFLVIHQCFFELWKNINLFESSIDLYRNKFNTIVHVIINNWETILIKAKSISTLKRATWNCSVSQNHYVTDIKKITGKSDHTVSSTDQKIDERHIDKYILERENEVSRYWRIDSYVMVHDVILYYVLPGWEPAMFYTCFEYNLSSAILYVVVAAKHNKLDWQISVLRTSRPEP